MRILTVKLESVVPVGHPAYRKDVEVRSFEKSSELHIEDALLARECFDQLDSLLDLDYLSDLVEGSKEDALDETEASVLHDLAEHQEERPMDTIFPNLGDFDQASYDKEVTEAMDLPTSGKANS